MIPRSYKPRLFRAGYLTLLVPKALRGQLVSGSSYVFSGQVGIYTHKGDLDVRLTVAAVTGRDDSSRLERLRAEQTLLERKIQRSPREVLKRHLERGERPRMALISGWGAIVGHDMFNQLGDAAQAFDFTEVKTNLSRPHEVARTLSEIDPKSVDVVALIRGGGDLDGVDALEVGEAAVRLSVPLITAIGHAEDKPLLQKLADVPLITPTEMGSYLRALAWEARQPVPDADTVTVSYELPGTDTRPHDQMRGVATTRRRREAQRQRSKRRLGRVVVAVLILALVLYTVLAWQGVVPDVITPLIELLGSLHARMRNWVSG